MVACAECGVGGDNKGSLREFDGGRGGTDGTVSSFNCGHGYTVLCICHNLQDVL